MILSTKYQPTKVSNRTVTNEGERETVSQAGTHTHARTHARTRTAKAWRGRVGREGGISSMVQFIHVNFTVISTMCHTTGARSVTPKDVAQGSHRPIVPICSGANSTFSVAIVNSVRLYCPIVPRECDVLYCTVHVYTALLYTTVAGSAKLLVLSEGEFKS
jgi:hypothetical protein